MPWLASLDVAVSRVTATRCHVFFTVNALGASF